jgi:hypothetical protein
MAAPAVVCKSNMKNLYWNVRQQLVHHRSLPTKLLGPSRREQRVTWNSTDMHSTPPAREDELEPDNDSTRLTAVGSVGVPAA